MVLKVKVKLVDFIYKASKSLPIASWVRKNKSLLALFAIPSSLSINDAKFLPIILSNGIKDLELI